tara:strand:+ start:1119 stop:1559 length:441 start_codon:yes stop_codon:yes gene_type:complete
MPINNSSIQINPLDLNKNAAIGVVFPLMNGGNFQQSLTIKEQVKSNIINVLLTERGERINQPNLGCGLKAILFENNVDSAQIEDLIYDQLQIYVPEIVVEEVEVNTDLDRHIILIKLIYGFILDNTLDSIQVNINQTNQSSPGMNG